MLPIGNDWDAVLAAAFASPQFAHIQSYLESTTDLIYPPAHEIFVALRLTPFARVRVVILGQDPYHTAGAAHGLAFSVREGVRIPPSLANIFTELHNDIGCPRPAHGNLTAWAHQGVLLLNTILTVQAGQPRSHATLGWQALTHPILTALNQRPTPTAFLLWGADAQKKAPLIDAPHHLCLTAAHPSPLARGKFYGSRPFSQANQFLQANGLEAIDWAVG